MPDLAKASQIVLRSYYSQAGLFYGSATGLNVGVGLIYDAIGYPLFNEESGVFETVEGRVYVLTHECDVDQANHRAYNSEILVCPITPFEDFCAQYEDEYSEGALFALLDVLGKDTVSRLMYVPPIPNHVHPTALKNGGVLYLNWITSTHISFFGEGRANAVCAVSASGLRFIDAKLQGHLLREKAQWLPRYR